MVSQEPFKSRQIEDGGLVGERAWERDSERRWWENTDRKQSGDNNNGRNPDELVNGKKE